MPYLTSKTSSSFKSAFASLMTDLQGCDEVGQHGSVQLGHRKVRVPVPTPPLQITLEGDAPCRLQLAPEILVDAAGRFVRGEDYLVIDPERCFSAITGFLRLAQGDNVVLGREELERQGMLTQLDGLGAQHVGIQLTDKGLFFRRESLTHRSCVAPLSDKDLIDRQIAWRRSRIEELARTLGAPIELLPRDEALALLERAIVCLAAEPHRTTKRDGTPGALLHFPDDPTPIIVGDLHARLDNLLVILTQNGFLKALRDGTALLVILGDAVHPEASGAEAEMETSMLMMDLILRLKVLFPTRVFYLRGNHDSFSDDISKSGVPQGLVWEQTLRDARGARYRDAMERFYDLLPYVAMSRDFLACHAGAPIGGVTRDALIHARENERLERQLTHGRVRQAKVAGGYRAADVKRFRKDVGLAPDVPFIVGHTPLTKDATYWLNVGGIDHHHILYSAADTSVGVMTRPGRELIPLRYPSEPLLGVYNRFVRTGKLMAGPEPTLSQSVTKLS